VSLRSASSISNVPRHLSSSLSIEASDEAPAMIPHPLPSATSISRTPWSSDFAIWDDGEGVVDLGQHDVKRIELLLPHVWRIMIAREEAVDLIEEI